MKSRIIKIVSLLLALVSVISLCACELKPLFEPEETTTEPPVVDQTPMVGEREAALRYLSERVDALRTQMPDASWEIEKSASKFKCEGNDESKVLEANLSGLADKVLDKEKGNYSHYSEGKPVSEEEPEKLIAFKDIIPVMGLEIADIENILWYEKDEKTYKIVVLLGEEENSQIGTGIYGKAYNLKTEESILQKFTVADDYFKVNGYKTKYHDGKIICLVDRATDEVTSLVYEKYVTVTADGEGVNTLEALGKQEIVFEYSEIASYAFDHNYNLNYVNGTLNNLKKEKAYKKMNFDVTSKTSTSADFTKTENDVLKGKFAALSDALASSKEDNYSTESGKYSKFKDFMPVEGKDTISNLTSADVVKPATATLNKGTESEYTFVVDVKATQKNAEPGNGVYGSTFNVLPEDYVEDAFKSIKDSYKLSSVKTQYHDGKITCVIDIETGEIKSAVFETPITVTATGECKGDLADKGEQTITFEMTHVEEYNFTHNAAEEKK